MEKVTHAKIDQQIFRQFPYLNGAIPEIEQQNEDRWLLIYKGSVTTADGHEMPIVVRVIVDNSGNVVKLTSSR
jgi:hypothetical protein